MVWHVKTIVQPTSVSLSCRAAPQPPTSTIESVIPWLTLQGATPTPIPLRVERTATAGNALFATHDIPPGAPLLTIPCDACIVQPLPDSADETEALGPMALALLRRLADGHNPWLDALPRRVDLPWLTWEPEELAALQDPETRLEAAHLQQRMLQLYQVGGCTTFCAGWLPRPTQSSSAQLAALSMDIEHLSWAYSLVLSRSFRLPPPANLRVLAPGIDLCNHDWAPSATVRHNTSPDASQGLDALAEVADVVGLQPAGARMELVAGPAGIPAAGPVSICYHTHPNDVFLLYYGFVPDSNPHV